MNKLADIKSIRKKKRNIRKKDNVRKEKLLTIDNRTLHQTNLLLCLRKHS